MTPPEPLARRMDILGRIAEAVVSSVVSCPPQRTFLSCRGPAKGHHELPKAIQPIGAVGKIAVVSGRNEEDSTPVQHEGQSHRTPGYARKYRQKRQYVQQREWNRHHFVDLFLGRTRNPVTQHYTACGRGTNGHLATPFDIVRN